MTTNINKREQFNLVAQDIAKYPAIIKHWQLQKYMDERCIVAGCGCGCGGDQIGNYYDELEQQGCDFQKYYEIILKLEKISQMFNIAYTKVKEAVEGITKKYFLKD